MSKRGCSKSIAKTDTESTFGGSNGVVVELKSRPKSSWKRDHRKLQKHIFLYIFGLIMEVFWRFFLGHVREPFWSPKMERQDGAGGGRMRPRGGRMRPRGVQEAAECRQNAEEFGAGQEYPRPPVQISYRNLVGYPAEKDLRRPWQPA